jgi:hypothetical protein
MSDEEMTRNAKRALELARDAWAEAHRDLPSNPMTRAAAIPAAGALAATLLAQLDEDDVTLRERVVAAIVSARRAWEQTHAETAGNPLAATAERAVIGIVAAGILNCRYPGGVAEH